MTTMKNRKQLSLLLTGLLIIGVSISSIGQTVNTEPWTEKQLMPPAELAQLINDNSAHLPVLFSIGPGAIVRGSVDIGPAKEKENLKKLKQQLSKLPKDTAIVIYCGCCPFQHCPNIRPAFKLLNKMKFTNHRLLNLPKNIKADWIDKGFPKN
jgi:thiosulfate/3-mercaptopyruvate sulfurtransferase